MNLKQCIDEYIEKSKDFLKLRTIDGYYQREKKIIQMFGNMDINDITQEFLQEYITAQQNSGRTKNAITNDLSLLLSAIKPYKTFNKFRYIITQADLQKEKKIYSTENLEKIENYIISKKEFQHRPYTAIMIAINTGMRIAEICSLKWSDIDFENNEITMARQVYRKDGKLYETTPKTKSGFRKIPMNNKLSEYLQFRKQNSSEDCFVVTNSLNPPFVRTIEKSNERLCQKLNVENCGMHAYRHCFATRLLEHSQDFKAVSQILGHSNISITQAIYNHPTEETKKNIIAETFGDNKKEEVPLPSPIQINNSESKQENMFLQQQINGLQKQIYDLQTTISRMGQYILDLQQNTPKKDGMKFKVISPFGKIKYFKTKYSLLKDLDIDATELKNYFNGEYTIINDLGLKVEEI